MPKAEGKIFSFAKESEIKTNFLETINYSGLEQEIIYETKEFNALCPFSGLPDIGQLIITYYPNKKIIELKSLKYYLTSFRNVGIYQEAATNRIYNDLWLRINPKKIVIKTVYNIRGGISSTCTIDSEKLKNKPK